MTIKYDNCKDCHSRCIHAGKDRRFICMNGISCKIAKAKPQTNADRVRAMSDEELADLLLKFATKPMQGSFLKWLQQPFEGE